MNLTKQQGKALSNLFEKIIMKYKVEDVLKTEINSDKDSYFIISEKETIDKQDFDLSIENENSVFESLKRAWKNLPIKDLASKIVKVSSKFKNIKKSEEISSLIYEMF